MYNALWTVPKEKNDLHTFGDSTGFLFAQREKQGDFKRYGIITQKHTFWRAKDIVLQPKTYAFVWDGGEAENKVGEYACL